MPAMRAPAIRLSVPLLVLLGACSMQVQGNDPGALTIDMPGQFPETFQLDRGQMPAADAIGPPPNLDAGDPVAGPPRSGSYAGIGRSTSDPMGGCQDTIHVTGFNVSGNQVQFGWFSGTIQPNGGLRMQSGARYVIGKFTGSHFIGQFWRQGLACNYAVSLEPV
jgi:hypothetical protein